MCQWKVILTFEQTVSRRLCELSKCFTWFSFANSFNKNTAVKCVSASLCNCYHCWNVYLSDTESVSMWIPKCKYKYKRAYTEAYRTTKSKLLMDRIHFKLVKPAHNNHKNYRVTQLLLSQKNVFFYLKKLTNELQATLWMPSAGLSFGPRGSVRMKL